MNTSFYFAVRKTPVGFIVTIADPGSFVGPPTLPNRTDHPCLDTIAVIELLQEQMHRFDGTQGDPDAFTND